MYNNEKLNMANKKLEYLNIIPKKIKLHRAFGHACRKLNKISDEINFLVESSDLESSKVCSQIEIKLIEYDRVKNDAVCCLHGIINSFNIRIQ